MPYATLLDNLIKESGMTAKEISQKCNELGVDVAPSYISLLRNASRNRTASDEVSIALAKVLGQKDNCLVLERVVDEAPKELRTALKNIFELSLTFGAKATGQEVPSVKAIVNSLPISVIINEMQALDTSQFYSNTVFQTNTNEQNNSNVKIYTTPELRVFDNALFPLIKAGNMVNIVPKNEFENGDIVALESNNNIVCRQYQIIDGTPMLIAYDSDFTSQPFDKNTMTILGKVHAVTTLL